MPLRCLTSVTWQCHLNQDIVTYLLTYLLLLGSWPRWYGFGCHIQVIHQKPLPPLGWGDRPLLRKTRSTYHPLCKRYQLALSFCTENDLFGLARRADQLFMAVMIFWFACRIHKRSLTSSFLCFFYGSLWSGLNALIDVFGLPLF